MLEYMLSPLQTLQRKKHEIVVEPTNYSIETKIRRFAFPL
jgi:hypothetical protein